MRRLGLALVVLLALRSLALAQVGGFYGTPLSNGGYYGTGYYGSSYYGSGYYPGSYGSSYYGSGYYSSDYYSGYYGSGFYGRGLGGRYLGSGFYNRGYYPGYYGSSYYSPGFYPGAGQAYRVADPRTAAPARIVIEPAPDDKTLRSRVPPQTVTLRVYATDDYVGQNVAWEDHFRRLVDRLNDRVGPWPGVVFEIEEMHSWVPKANEDDVEALLAELEQHDPGEDVDWVVGLASALPHAQTSIHEFGIARPLGRHMILRSLHELMEAESLRRQFAAALPEKLEELLEARKHHKEEVIFLHEWGHSLGALHVGEEHLIMNPTYSPLQEQYGAHAAHVVALAMRRRLAPQVEPEDEWRVALAPELRAFVTGPAGAVWEAKDREHLLAAIDRLAPPRDSLSAVTAPPVKHTLVNPSGPKKETALRQPLQLLPPELR
ncbi:MAG TPA: hypothetical protein VH877_08730 [Polyangia bacterium]|jgi:hypothetical protein|nr:hypothetical protein [Polyangia bacterium]